VAGEERPARGLGQAAQREHRRVRIGQERGEPRALLLAQILGHPHRHILSAARGSPGAGAGRRPRPSDFTSVRGLFRWAALAAALAALAVPAAVASAAGAGAGAPTHQTGKKKKKKPPTPALAITPGFTSGPGIAISRAPVGLSLEYPLMA